jgi:hypothetical protein
MPQQTRIVSPGPSKRTFKTADRKVVHAPADWAHLKPGDAALTRRVKLAGPSWTVQEKRGNRVFSLGVWAPAATIKAIRAQLEAERSTEAYAKRRQADAARRQRKQIAYVEDFRGAVVKFLAFAPPHAELAERLAVAVAARATPVGSGTVARTERIPIERRAELAVIAWLRHKTTGYDAMKISRAKGSRRKVRQRLAKQSRRLLEAYRAGQPVEAAECLLRKGLPI